MISDPVALIIERLERPVMPSAAFADTLLSRLLKELEGKPAVSLRERAKALLPSWLPSRRLVLVAILALVLLACAAAAVYYVSTKTWLSTGPRGIQFTSDFELVELFRDDDPRTDYEGLVVGPAGSEIYAIRISGQEEAERFDPLETAIVRISGLPDGQAQVEPILRFSELGNPALWDLDLGSPALILPGLGLNPGKLSVAGNGDLFLLAAAWTGVEELTQGARRPEAAPAGASLIVRHTDGTLQKVLTLGELLDAGLIDTTEPLPAGPGLIDTTAGPQVADVVIAASAPDQLWLQLITLEQVGLGNQNSIRRFIFEVRDPNGDGDWSDRTVVSLTLPDFVAEQQRPDCCLFMDLLAEPSPDNGDHSRSLLLLVSLPYPDPELRIYRVSDQNRDGDVLDDGEFELAFARVPASADATNIVAPRTVVEDGKVVLREFLISGLTAPTRISRITEAGEVVDIARAFGGILDLLTDSEGNIYVWAYSPQLTGPVLYKLKPVAEGESAQSETATVAAELTPIAVTEASPEPQPTSEALTPGVPRIAFSIERYPIEGSPTSEIFLMGVGGGDPVRLVDGEHNQGFGQCPSGSRFFYWSDEEVPNEPFLYVANADGSDPRKVTEEPTAFVWCASDGSLMRVVGAEQFPSSVIRYEPESGQESTVLSGVDWRWLWPDPDGRRAAFVSGMSYSEGPPPGQESLEVLDLESGERRRLDGPRTDKSYHGLAWSSDGQRVAYVIGPRISGYGSVPLGYPFPADFDVYVRDVNSGEAKLVYRAEDAPWPPGVKLSPGGDWLLISRELVPTTGLKGRDCGQEESAEAARQCEEEFSLQLEEVEDELVLVNVESGEARHVATAQVLYFAEWAPSGDSFAYATGEAAYLESVDGQVRRLAAATEGSCSFCLDYSFGWSPDGRYIGLVRVWSWGPDGPWPAIAVLDTTTGEVRTLFELQGEDAFLQPRWWR